MAIRSKVNESLSRLNFEGLLIIEDGWERCVQSLEPWFGTGHKFYCEGDQEGWDQELGPDQIGCDETASWRLVGESSSGSQFYCSSCLLEKVAKAKVVSGEVTFFEDRDDA